MNDKKRRMTFVILSLIFTTCLTLSVYSEESPTLPIRTSDNTKYRILPDVDKVHSTLSFVSDSLCYINDPKRSLSDFFNELIGLLHGKDTIIHIVHLGDSHIQAGFLSGRTMRLLHHSFGNAGRGWIAPFKLSKVNEPLDYYILSNVKDWITGRCIQSNPKCPWGIGGIGIQTNAKDIDFRLIMTPENGAGYSFNKVLMYSGRTSVTASTQITIDTFTTTHLVDTFSIRSMDAQGQSNNLYYGFNLLNGNPGILYHAIGVNGAKYVDYTTRDYIRQLSLLNPSLLIISLGTNESFGRNFSKESFEIQINSLIRLVREELPKTAILMTTPAESFKSVYVNKKRQYVRNENIAKTAAVISAYSEKEGLACWDLYAISGGENSCKKWFDAKMLSRDRIHFSREGYEQQGVLLYKAIARSCVLPIREWEMGNGEWGF